jgi:hypothetical protein
MNSMMQHIGGLKIVSQPHFVTGSPTIGTHDGNDVYDFLIYDYIFEESVQDHFIVMKL